MARARFPKRPVAPCSVAIGLPSSLFSCTSFPIDRKYFISTSLLQITFKLRFQNTVAIIAFSCLELFISKENIFCLFKKTEKQTPVKTQSDRGYESKQTIFHFDQSKQIKISILFQYNIKIKSSWYTWPNPEGQKMTIRLSLCSYMQASDMTLTNFFQAILLRGSVVCFVF